MEAKFHHKCRLCLIIWNAYHLPKEIKFHILFFLFRLEIRYLGFYAGVGRGNVDGSILDAKFGLLVGICADLLGNIIVSDYENKTLRKILRVEKEVVTLCKADSPCGICVDSNNSIYFANRGSRDVRRVIGVNNVLVIAGNKSENIPPIEGLTIDDGRTCDANFGLINGLCYDASKECIYVADSGSNKIKKILLKDYSVSVIAGSHQGDHDGDALKEAEFSFPFHLCLSQTGDLYFSDYSNHKVKVLQSNGIVRTLAGTGSAGYADGVATHAQFNNPAGLSLGSDGILYVADRYNHCFRTIEFPFDSTPVVGTFRPKMCENETTTPEYYKTKEPTGVTCDCFSNIFMIYSDHEVRRYGVI